jgi:hypothetical protein
MCKVEPFAEKSVRSLTCWRKMVTIYVCTTCYNIQKLCILPTQCIYVFRMILTINSDYFPKQH